MNATTSIQHSLSDEPYSLRETWVNELYAILLFPNDLNSARQFGLILNDHDRTGATEPSAMLKAASEPVAWRPAGQRMTAGLVAIALVSLKRAGERPSITSAAKVVAEYGGTSQEGLIIGFSGGELKVKAGKVPEDQRTVEKYFRKYKRAAHLAAVSCIITEYYDWEAGVPIKDCPEFSARMLHSVLYFQEQLHSILGSDWGHWHILAHPPFSFSDFPPLVPSDETVSKLFLPFLRQHQGI